MPNHPGILGDILHRLQGQARARPDLGQDQPIATFAGRVVRPGEEIGEVISRLPVDVPDGGGSGVLLASSPALRGVGGKVFRPAPSGLQAQLARLLKAEQVLPDRSRLIPAIRIKGTGQVFEGPVGGNHPIDRVTQFFTNQRKPVPGGGLEFGFKLAEEGAEFIPEQIASVGRTREGLNTLVGLMSKGSTEDVLVDLLKQGRLK